MKNALSSLMRSTLFVPEDASCRIRHLEVRSLITHLQRGVSPRATSRATLPMSEPPLLRCFERPFEIQRVSPQHENVPAIMHEIVRSRPTLEGAWCFKVNRQW